MCCENSQHIFFVSGCWCYTRTFGTQTLVVAHSPRPSLSLLSRGLRANAYLRHAAGALQRWCAVVLRDEACCVVAWVGAVRVPLARTPLVGVHSPRPSLSLLSRGLPTYMCLRHAAGALQRWCAVVLRDEACCVKAWLVLYAYLRHAADALQRWCAV